MDIYFSKTNVYGWRYALVVDNENKVVRLTDSFKAPANADLVVEELLQRELRSIRRQLIRNGYTDLSK